MPVDFGYGGWTTLDGEVVKEYHYDLWNKDELGFSGTVDKGPHTIEIFGSEGCCDGEQIWKWSGESVEFPNEFVNEKFSLRTLNYLCPTTVEYPDTHDCDDATLMQVSPIDTSGYLEAYEMVIWSIEMHKGQTVGATTTGTNDIDLFMRWNNCPTKYVFDERGFSSTG